MKNNCRLILILTLCLALPSCSQAATHSFSSQTASSSEAVQPAPSAKVPSLKMLTSPDGLLFSSGAPAPDGFYDVFLNHDGSANIIYYDYAARQTIYLSNQVNSNHKDTSDTSYLEFAMGGVFPLNDGEYLYILKAPNSPLLRTGQEGGKGYLLRMDPNGQNRAAISLPAALKPALTSPVVGAAGNFIFLAHSTNKDNTSQYKLLSTNFEKGALDELYSFEPDVPVFLLGSAGTQLLLCTALPDSPPSALLLFDPAEGAIKPLPFDLNQKQFFMAGGKLLFLSFGSVALYEYDPLAAATRQVTASVVPDPLLFDELQLGQHVVDGFFFVQAYNLQKNRYERFAVDLETGELRAQKLTDGDSPVQIISDAGEYYMVSLKDLEVTYDDFTPDGIPIKNVMLCPHYALIRKEDYWSGIPHYIEFENQVFHAG